MKIIVSDQVVLFSYHSEFSPTIGDELIYNDSKYKVKRITHYTSGNFRLDSNTCAANTRDYEILVTVEREKK